MTWSLNQASHETGVAKATILRALKSGRMSAPKNELGQYEIDPSEFFRVFPPTPSEPATVPGTRTGTDRAETPNETGWLEAEVRRLGELLRMTNQEREREREQAANEIRFLRGRVEHGDSERDELAAERRTLTARLLTYERPPEPPATPPAASGPSPDGPASVTSGGLATPSRRGFLGLFRRAS